MTSERPLPGGDVGRLASFRARALAAEANVGATTINHLLDLHGARYRDVLATSAEDPSLLCPIAPGVPDVGAAVSFAVREEQALHLLDVLLRRTGLGTLGAPDVAVVERVASIMADELQWSSADVARERALVTAYYRRSMEAIGL